ncbi:MAG: hypothetical protein CMO80_14125 [Verrucomicrobiales bacterium]|nr:hypothetical protein [Verrucomicrobiales bacterium]|tara:strand:- start:257 stop:742 length:486 start_codon:yes stop_codon:yes gene_type:complete
MADLWNIFTDLDYALSVVEMANDVYRAYPGPDALIGLKIPPPNVKKASATRARHAATIGAVELPPVEPETIFSIAARTKQAQDVQWAVLTLLAIDATFREEVARKSPPMAAQLARELPARFERYIMGKPPNIAAMTPHEAVLDFTLSIQTAFSTITETASV